MQTEMQSVCLVSVRQQETPLSGKGNQFKMAKVHAN